MPNSTPELLTAVEILEQDSVVDPTSVGGRVLTGGVSSNSAVNLSTEFIGSEGVGRGGDKQGSIPLGKTFAPGVVSSNQDDIAGDDQAFLARVVSEAIDIEFPEMAEVGEGVLIYLLNRFAGYDEFRADPLLYSDGAPRYQLDITYPTPMIGGDPIADPPVPATPSPSLTEELIHENRKKTYLYRFIDCVFNDIKNNPYVYDIGVSTSPINYGEITENLIVEKDFLTCSDLIPTCLSCMQSVLDIKGDDEISQSPCDGKVENVLPDNIVPYINLLILPPVEAIQKVIDYLGTAPPKDDTDNIDSELPKPCIFGMTDGCSPLQPYLDKHLQKYIAHKLSEEGLFERYFQEAMCQKLKDGYFMMPFPPIATIEKFEVSLPEKGKAWFDALPDDELPGFKDLEPAMGSDGVTYPSSSSSSSKGFDPNTKKNIMAIFTEISKALGKDLDRDVVPPLQTGSNQLLSLSIPSPIIPWVEITELEKVSLEKDPVTRVMGPHMAHAILEWAVDQIPKIDLRILGLPVFVGPPPYLGLMGSIPPPPSFPKEPLSDHPMSEYSLDGAELPEVEVKSWMSGVDLSDTPDLPDVPDMPDLPDVPDLPDMTDVPDLPDMPDIPDLPDMPDIPDLPNVPDVPDLPNVPDMPDVPQIPGSS